MAETMVAWMAPTVEAFSPQCWTWPGTKSGEADDDRGDEDVQRDGAGESAAEAIAGSGRRGWR